MKLIKKIVNLLLAIFTFDGELVKEAIEQNALSFEGQGRDVYGK